MIPGYIKAGAGIFDIAPARGVFEHFGSPGCLETPSIIRPWALIRASLKTSSGIWASCCCFFLSRRSIQALLFRRGRTEPTLAPPQGEGSREWALQEGAEMGESLPGF